MIQTFKNQATQNIFNGEVTKQALKICPRNIWKIASRKLDQLDSVSQLDELRVPPGNKLEALQRTRKGQFRSLYDTHPDTQSPHSPGRDAS